MIKFKLLLFIYLLFFSCEHPEHKDFDRHSQSNTHNNAIENPQSQEVENLSSKYRTVIKMNKMGGVYEVPVEINGVLMSFIFDTGAGIISISATEALFLMKQGKIEDSDIIGTSNYIDANGNVSVGTEVNLKSVKIGDFEIENVKASVVHNQVAPLLLGQSALSRFGKVSIDYQTEELIIEY